MGIVRGVASREIEPLVETVMASGLETLEITLNTKGACDLIRQTVKIAKGRLTVGAGTVLDIKGLKLCLDAGAAFIVMPVVVDEVLAYCVKNKVPVFPGALTPTEIYSAWLKGATMVKVFPAKFLGPEYFREVKAPFNDVQLLACSGVTPENLKDYFSCGASAVSFGASVFRKEWFANKDFESVGNIIKRYIEAFRRL